MRTINKTITKKLEMKIECHGNTCFKVYQKKRFIFIPYWSYACTEATITAARLLIRNLRLINNEKI